MARVLVIDDDDDLRELLRFQLERKGHQVAEARDGRRGLRAVREHEPDLVLCDIVMPDQEGIETIQAIRRSDPDLPIVAMSGGLQLCPVDVLEMAKHLGAWKAIAKPFSMKQVLELVEQATAEMRV